MIWLISQLPELEHLDQASRKVLVKRARPSRFYSNAIAKSVLISLFVTFLMSLLWQVTIGEATRLVVYGFYVVFALLAIQTYRYELEKLRHIVRETISKLSKQERLPVCFSCGYSLHGIESDHCPECGAPTRIFFNQSSDSNA